ncbi:hypothetical protein EKH57_17095 [Halorubrum sp. BOL3-1]|uniref:hypothetical protein n=1 Tax=Halorubrum sp. BOL3-1 TaxID=2497325 RepID=UPI001004F299|nr:hypothetical protein [Halorubrum sp. BOL3-1]QAU14243.1 hypothetical protein EKH57_17095 [Halorubrum sp. BOL3-1]
MTDSSSPRRRFLAGIASAGAAATAGCSGLPFGDGQEPRADPVSLPSDAIGPTDRPASPFPATVPGALADAHETRTRGLLDAVPTEPSLPNEAVATEIGADRERALGRARADIPDRWSIDILAAWRRRRGDAATVRGAYRAATGVDDGSDLVARRREIRDDSAALAGDLEYRAGSVEEAVVAYEPVESLLAECARHVRPRVRYPDDPISDPFRAGEAVGGVERGRATAADAAGLRSAFLAEGDSASPQWGTLIAAAEELRGSVSRTHSAVRERVGGAGDDSSSGGDLSGTVAQELLTASERRVESAVEEVEEAADAGEPATATVEAGVALAAIDALRAANAEIGEGRYREAPTESSVRSAAERARSGVDTAVDGADPLATRLVRPAFETLELLDDRVEEGYAPPRQVTAELAFVALYASAVPRATAFVRERLD